jgi:UDP-glucose:glycoprotein glucosyltransferase
MYNVVVVFDLSRPSGLRFITNTLSMLIDRLFPVRFGIVPIVETEDSVKMAKVFYYMVQNYDRRATMGFFGSVRTICLCHCLLSFMSHKILDVSGAKEQVDWLHVQAQFEALVTNEETSGEEEVMSFESVLGSATDELQTKFSKARLYAQRLGTTAASAPDGHIFINGKYHVANDVCCRTIILRCYI